MKAKSIHQTTSLNVAKESTKTYVDFKLMYLEAFLDLVEEALAFIDIHLNYQFINQAYAEWLGTDKNGIQGKNVSEVFSNDSFQRYLPNYIKAFQGECVTFEFMEKSSLAEVTLVPQYKDSEIKGCICLLKKKSQIDVPSSTNDFFNLTSGLLSITDSNGYFLKCNQGWEKTLGYNLAEIKALSLFDLVHPDEMGNFKKFTSNLDPEITRFNNRFACKDGTYRWLEGHIARKDEHHFTIAIDVTQHVENEYSLKESESVLIELNATKDKFFSIISHDLKSPFNNILGFANLLNTNINAYDKDLSKQIANQLYHSAKMAFELLENLLDWSCLQTNRIEFEPAVVDLEELLNNCLPMMQLMASTKQISIEVSVPQKLMVVADQNITRTIIRNLVSNAVKFSNKNKTVILTAVQKDNHASVSIADEGVGMSSRIMEKLFRIDTKYTSPGTMNERGTGLGLILCKDFVEKQGGVITIESTEGKGSTFTFTIPLNIA